MDDQMAAGALAALMGSMVFLVILLGVVAFGILIWWRIFSKTGMGGALSLLMLIPLVNIVMMIILAFSEWPVEKELKELKRKTYAPPTPSTLPLSPPSTPTV